MLETTEAELPGSASSKGCAYLLKLHVKVLLSRLVYSRSGNQPRGNQVNVSESSQTLPIEVRYEAVALKQEGAVSGDKVATPTHGSLSGFDSDPLLREVVRDAAGEAAKKIKKKWKL